MIEEILAPCGNIEMANAAIHNGAGAIYLGAPGLNARGRTIDFSLDEISAILDLCHLHGVRVFMAMNILIFERELQTLEPYLRQVLALGIDAVIVQDIGLVKLINKIAPEQTIHASTQMTVSSAEAIHETADLNLTRYVLSREMSLNEISQVRAHTEKELEVFVHGALCVSYSGQCLTSESFGGRSANRGQCAQSCRLDYKLYVDGLERELGSKKYLFSPQDLCGVEEISQLQEIGVNCFKIEGRLKSPEYVASVVSNYYQATRHRGQSTPSAMNEMGSTYSRGLYPGWLHGVKHQELVGGIYSSNQGVLVGKIISQARRDRQGPQIQVQPLRSFNTYQPPHEIEHLDLKAGDGVLFFQPVSGKSWGTKIYQVNGNTLGLSRELPVKEIEQLAQGWEVYRNSSPHIETKLQRSWKDKQSRKKMSIWVEISMIPGESIRMKIKDQDGNEALAFSSELVESARNKFMNEASIIEGMGGFGGSSYSAIHHKVDIQGKVFTSNKTLRALKQTAIETLNQKRCLRLNPCQETKVSFPTWKEEYLHNMPQKSTITSPHLNLLIRREDQIDELHHLPLQTVIMDFEFGKDYKIGLAKIRKMGYQAGIATLRVFKPGEDHHLKVIKWLKPNVILVRNLGALNWLKCNMDLSQTLLIGDHSLNITNSMTAEWMQDHGLDYIQPAHDCNKQQLFDLVQQYGSESIDLSLHHYMPTFHMEHCVFAAFLSNGNTVKDCGKPCESHQVEVRDHKGAQHFLKSDQECRNTLYNGLPQSASRLIRELLDFGVNSFRIEALLEDSRTLVTKVNAYAKLIQGEISPQNLFEELGVLEKYGITEGQLFNHTPFQDRKKERK